MTDFVFLHGSFHAAWNWHKLLPVLDNAGHRGHALDLPGHGLDPVAAEDVTMDACVNRVVEALAALPDRAVLVAHSRNGMVISQVAERCPERIFGLVYLAAYLVPNGRSMMDYALLDRESLVVRNCEPRVSARLMRRVGRLARSAVGRGVLNLALPARLRTHSLRREVFKEALYHDCADEITELANTLLEPEPTLPGFTPLHLTPGRYGSVPKVYIECTEDRAVTPMIQRQMYSDTPCDRVFSLAASHSPFFSCPERLTELLLESLEVFAPGTQACSSQQPLEPAHELEQRAVFVGR